MRLSHYLFGAECGDCGQHVRKLVKHPWKGDLELICQACEVRLKAQSKERQQERIGRLDEETRKAKEAEEEEFERVFRLDMDHATAMGYCREAAELRRNSRAVNLARVEGVYRAVVKACPDFWMGHFGLGEVLTTGARENREGAQAALRRAVRLAPRERAPLLELAGELCRWEFDDAIAYYAEAAELPPGTEEETLYPINLQATRHWDMAIEMGKKGQEASAVEAFLRAIGLNPKYYISVIQPENALANACWRRAVQRYRQGERMESRAAQKANMPTPQLGIAGTRCSRCGKDLGAQWHYGFESILIALDIGLQCPDCGTMFCPNDNKDGNEKINDCPKCGGRLVKLMEGPALSSMVDQARDQSRYRGAIKEPSFLGRPIETG